MTKTYYQKENINLWYIITVMCIGVIVFGFMLIKYFAWQVLPIIAIGISKIIKLSKNPEVEAIALNEERITLLNLPNHASYLFSNIADIKLGSKFTNGYLVLKDTKKKVILNSVAISLEDQKEINALIKSKIELTNNASH